MRSTAWTRRSIGWLREDLVSRALCVNEPSARWRWGVLVAHSSPDYDPAALPLDALTMQQHSPAAVKSVDMTDEMQTEVIQICNDSFDRNQVEKDIAAGIKKVRR